MAKRPRELIRTAHVDDRNAIGSLDAGCKLVHLDPVDTPATAQAPNEPRQECHGSQHREGEQAVADRRGIAGGRFAAGVAEPSIGERSGQHADHRGYDVVPEGYARQAEGIIGEVEREERHEPHKGDEAPAFGLDAVNQSLQVTGRPGPSTQSAATKRPTTNAAVAPSVAPARFRIVPQSGPNSRATGRARKSHREGRTIVPSAKSTTWPTGAQAQDRAWRPARAP